MSSRSCSHIQGCHGRHGTSLTSRILEYHGKGRQSTGPWTEVFPYRTGGAGCTGLMHGQLRLGLVHNSECEHKQKTIINSYAEIMYSSSIRPCNMTLFSAKFHSFFSICNCRYRRRLRTFYNGAAPPPPHPHLCFQIYLIRPCRGFWKNHSCTK